MGMPMNEPPHEESKPLPKSLALNQEESQANSIGGADKLQLEILKLRNDILTDRIKTAALVLGAISFLAVFALDRWKVNEQRDYENKIAACHYRVERMTTIAASMEKQVSDTAGTVASVHFRATALYLAVSSAAERLKEVRPVTHALTEQQKFLEDQAKTLSDENMEVDDWAAAARIESVWSGQSETFSPDFTYLFGRQIAADWKAVVQKALTALRETFSVVGGSAGARDAFEPAAYKIQSEMTDKIEEVRASCR
jgi:hypothetical protein